MQAACHCERWFLGCLSSCRAQFYSIIRRLTGVLRKKSLREAAGRGTTFSKTLTRPSDELCFGWEQNEALGWVALSLEVQRGAVALCCSMSGPYVAAHGHNVSCIFISYLNSSSIIICLLFSSSKVLYLSSSLLFYFVIINGNEKVTGFDLNSIIIKP